MATIDNIRKQRNLPFLKRGMKVFYHITKKFGVVTGVNNSLNLNIKFDGNNYSENCHPYYELTYYDKNNNIVKSYHKENNILLNICDKCYYRNVECKNCKNYNLYKSEKIENLESEIRVLKRILKEKRKEYSKQVIEDEKDYKCAANYKL